MCSTEEWKPYRFAMIWGWVNDDNFFFKEGGWLTIMWLNYITTLQIPWWVFWWPLVSPFVCEQLSGPAFSQRPEGPYKPETLGPDPWSEKHQNHEKLCTSASQKNRLILFWINSPVVGGLCQPSYASSPWKCRADV